MYLERFVADGYLDADRVEMLRGVAHHRGLRIVLVVGGRRVLAPNLAFCWEELAVGPGTPIVVEVSSGTRNLLDAEQRAIAGYADRFREVLIPPAPRRTRWWRR